MPKLRELEAHFARSYDREPTAEERALNPQFPADYRMKGYRYVDTLAEADGLIFLCPLCFAKNGGAVGTHGVAIPFPNAPDGQYIRGRDGSTPKWRVVGGSTLDDLQLAPSIQLLGDGCNWHGFVGSSGVPPGEAR